MGYIYAYCRREMGSDGIILSRTITLT